VSGLDESAYHLADLVRRNAPAHADDDARSQGAGGRGGWCARRVQADGGGQSCCSNGSAVSRPLFISRSAIDRGFS
jgi:hypothetical protein